MNATSGRRTILAARVLLLGGAAAALAGALSIRLRAERHQAVAARYVCPMHPEVRAAAPGTCPICRMALEAAAPLRPVSPRQRAEMSDLAAVDNVRKHNVVDFVRVRTPLFNVRDMRGPAWAGEDGRITAIFYRDQVAAMADDEVGRFSATRDPAQVWEVRRAGGGGPWDGATARVDFRAPRPAAAPPPGTVGWLELARRPREMLTVPAPAVVQSPEGPYVLVATGGLAVEKRPIEIGETFFKQGFAVVLSGLKANERVVARATFFLDADRRLAGP